MEDKFCSSKISYIDSSRSYLMTKSLKTVSPLSSNAKRQMRNYLRDGTLQIGL